MSLAQARHVALATIEQHSKSFSFASRLLPAAIRRDAVVLYAWCRRADDVVDEAVDHAEAAKALDRLEGELASLYRGEKQADPLLEAFRELVERRRMPGHYARELLAGMRMDLEGTRYDDTATLDLYCWRVAGVVGLMMCHVMGVSDERALAQASHLGMAMQLTNICRDVGEDWERGRLYLPDDLLARHGLSGLSDRLGRAIPPDAAQKLPIAVRALLDRADGLYRSGRAGLPALPWRCAVAIAAAAAVYADIGTSLERQGFDPLRGRAHTTKARKILLAVRAFAGQLFALPNRWRARFSGSERPYLPPATVLETAAPFAS